MKPSQPEWPHSRQYTAGSPLGAAFSGVSSRQKKDGWAAISRRRDERLNAIANLTYLGAARLGVDRCIGIATEGGVNDGRSFDGMVVNTTEEARAELVEQANVAFGSMQKKITTEFS